MPSSLLRPLLTVFAGSVLATGLFAQTPAAPKLEFPAASPAATLKQRVGITDIEITYSRPSMRGRKIFGGLEPYGAVWRTGADNATKITFSTPVKFGGVDVPAGTYALFSIPGESEWTVILNRVSGQWGSYGYDAANDVARARVKPVALATPVETFAIGIADIGSNSATLYLAWENTRVPVKLEVDVVGMLVPQVEAVMASSAEKKPYFSAAMFYYANNLDLDKALAWMDAGLAEQPKAYWMIYRKGLILAKKGDKAGAIAAAKQSLALAASDPKAPPPLKEEYTRLNHALIASLQ
ncbi:MAG: DUF2911 domain-containing protein [Opitutaceae bacterium]|nr:DUF2911 domain-containing protein [Opitutaceae bacterium]